MTNRLPYAWVLVASTLVSSAANGGFYRVEVTASAVGGFSEESFLSGPAPVTTSTESVSPYARGFASGSAGRGIATGLARADAFNVVNPPQGSRHAFSAGESFVSGTDLLFSSSQTMQIPVRFNLVLSGDLSRTGTYGAEVGIYAAIGQGTNFMTLFGTSTESSNAPPSSTGHLSGYAIGSKLHITSPEFLITTNMPASMAFFVRYQTSAGNGGANLGSAELNYSFSFPIDGLAFDVPSGISVNSIDLGIEDNRLIPEPAISFVSLLPAALLGRTSRRKSPGCQQPGL